MDLEPLLRAQSIAIVGASPKVDSFGWHVVKQLQDFGYPGRIVPINPNYDTVEGLRCLPSLSDLDAPVDCAAICIGDEHLEGALDEAVVAGARSAVIFGAAAGTTAEGVPLGEELRDIARLTGIPVMGANCMGFFNFADRLLLTGYPYHRPPERAPSHSSRTADRRSRLLPRTRGG